ncbi:3767_t:CDS:1, partial [Racocetra fulgida]
MEIKFIPSTYTKASSSTGIVLKKSSKKGIVRRSKKSSHPTM